MSSNNIRLGILVLAFSAILIGCESVKDKDVNSIVEDMDNVVIVENSDGGSPGESYNDTVSKTEVDENENTDTGSAQWTNEDIKAVYLKDINGKILKSDFTGLEINDILYAFFNSEIVESQNTKPFVGNSLTLIPDDGLELTIYSYGQESFIVAVVEVEAYHLKSDLISNLLLTSGE